jgi:hypothetical protein
MWLVIDLSEWPIMMQNFLVRNPQPLLSQSSRKRSVIAK